MLSTQLLLKIKTREIEENKRKQLRKFIQTQFNKLSMKERRRREKIYPI
jgi:hypothetical protein